MLHWLVALALILCPVMTIRAEDINAGFVRGFWYSSDEVFANTDVRVYVAIRNNTGTDLTGTVTFFANDTKLGTQAVSALNNRIIESWIDWKPAYGEHTLRAELSRVKLSAVGSASETVDTALAAATDTLFVDFDTDRDGVGNKVDIDDDGDGISDEVETQNGTDPLSFTERDAPLATSSSTTPTRPRSDREDTDEAEGGIERYLTPSRADTILSAITAWASSTKVTIDTYRTARASTQQPTNTEVVAVDSDGFGTISRSTDPLSSVSASDRAQPGFVTDVVHLIGTLLGGLFTLLLMLASTLLSHAVLIQLLILFTIPACLYVIARKLGGRQAIPKKKK